MTIDCRLSCDVHTHIPFVPKLYKLDIVLSNHFFKHTNWVLCGTEFDLGKWA